MSLGTAPSFRSLPPNRVTPDVSTFARPAVSFAHLRSSHQHLLRADSIRGAPVQPHPARHKVRKAKAAREARTVNPTLAKHFPLLRETLNADGGAEVATEPSTDSVHTTPSSLGPVRERRKKRSGKLRVTGGLRAHAPHSRSRLFDPRLTASAMEEINWLPRFRESISRSTLNATAKSAPGSFDTGALGGTNRGGKPGWVTNPLPHGGNKAPFIPSGGAAAKRGVQSDLHGFLSVGTNYDALRKKRLAEDKESRERFLAGRFRGTNKAEAAKLVQVQSYLNSPDEEALELEKAWIREKTLLATSEFTRKRVGREWACTCLVLLLLVVVVRKSVLAWLLSMAATDVCPAYCSRQVLHARARSEARSARGHTPHRRRR